MHSSAEHARCRATLKGGSRSFHLAAGLLPPRVREPAAVLYAFCREADDLVDQGGGISALRVLYDRLARLSAPLQAAQAGHALVAHETGNLALCDQLLADVLRRHRIPPEVLAGLLEGFGWDVEGRQYAGADDVLAYAMRVAGTVGLAMALVMGVRGRRPLLAAVALGVGMQLTNICRDVAEDARLGRLYLPLDWLAEEGIDAREFLLDPCASAGLTRVVARVLALADACYAVGDAGLASLPRDCQGGIRAARRLYSGIGHRLRRQGGDPMRGRTVVPLLAKLSCLVAPERVAIPASAFAAAEQACDLAAQPFLAHFPDTLLQPQAEEDREGGRVVWVLDLFERLERRNMALRAGEGDARA